MSSRGRLFGAATPFYGDGEALVLETTSAAHLPRYWALCTQMVALTRSKYLVKSGADPRRWTDTMNAILTADVSEMHARLRQSTKGPSYLIQTLGVRPFILKQLYTYK